MKLTKQHVHEFDGEWSMFVVTLMELLLAMWIIQYG